MADYKAMYYKLFNKVSDVIAELQDIQLQTEDIYTASEKPEIRLPPQEPKKEWQGRAIEQSSSPAAIHFFAPAKPGTKTAPMHCIGAVQAL